MTATAIQTPPSTTGTKAVSQFLNSPKMLEKFTSILGEKAQGFIASIITIVNSSKMLQNATPDSIYTAALTAAALDLPLNQNLGFAYIVPYNNTKEKKQEAQFQMGWKGYVQLAQRSGQYKNISVAVIYEGQLISENPLTGFVFDFTQKKSDKVIGYAAAFSLINGFEKIDYMSKEKAEIHAKTYSQSYKSNNKWVVDSSRWTLDFDAMALKTVLKLLISKFGPMSIEMQKAQIADQSVIRNFDTLEVDYVDNHQLTAAEIDSENEALRISQFIQGATDLDTLESIKDHILDQPQLELLFEAKKQELTK